MVRNISLYPWFKFVQQLVFWQAVWFLYFESRLSGADALLLYVVLDISATVLEVPSGYMSDHIGRRLTLIAAGLTGFCATLLLIFGEGFGQFAFANLLLGAATAFASGTDSSLLFESLKAEGREAEIEVQEIKAWRFGFTALALSALIGGGMSLYDDTLPYVATAICAFVLLAVTTLFKEPPHTERPNHRENLYNLYSSFSDPTLLWLFCLTLLMYVFSHIPYIFGQPFIRESLASLDYGPETPLVSGGVTFLMMIISLGVSLIALPLRTAFGVKSILLLAFGMQIALTIALAVSNSLIVIVLLFFRMVPDSLSRPFILARIQPLLKDGTRATYLSLQSLAGRLLFAITITMAAGRTTGDATMPYSELQLILAVYAALGLIFWIGLALATRRVEF